MCKIFENNLQALQKTNLKLYTQIKEIQTNTRFDVFQEGIAENINIFDNKNNVMLYDDPIIEYEQSKKDFEKNKEYDFLYFFGVGNGIVMKYLLENKKLQRLIVIEPEIELIYIIFNLIDFSSEIKTKRLQIILADNLTYNTAIKLFVYKNALHFARVYQLQAMLSYYEEAYTDVIVDASSILTNALEYVVSIVGNSVIDQFVGVKQHFQNIPQMLHSPEFKQLLRKKNTNIAIVVATGPSLHKQLALLDKVKEYVTIISVDASLPVLEKNNIKPDIVVSMERDEIADIFHKKTSKEFQEDIIFVCASLQHENVFNAIKAGTTVLAMRPFAYNSYLDLNDYGYVCSGLSSANMAHELAAYMHFDTCIFIGQDLAYGKDGSSHSKGHVLGEDFIKDGEMKTHLLKEEMASGSEVQMPDKKVLEQLELPAYGGEGMVKSIHAWKLFLDGLIQSVEEASSMKSINSTEGGARIKGTLELPFDKAIEEYADFSKKKKKITLQIPDPENYPKLKQKVDIRVQKILDDGQELLDEIKETFLFISDQCLELEHKSKEEARDVFTNAQIMQLLEKISHVRESIEISQAYDRFYHDIVQSTVVHQELELMVIKVWAVENPQENQDKALQWILSHRYWLFSLAGGIEHTITIIKEAYKFD